MEPVNTETPASAPAGRPTMTRGCAQGERWEVRRGLLALYQAFVTSCSSTGGCRTSSFRRCALGCSQSDGTHAQPRVKTVVSLAAFYRCCETTRMHSTILFIYLFTSFFFFFWP